jgi:hypothetical protein
MPSNVAAGDMTSSSDAETARLLASLLKIGREVVSDHQAVINDPSGGGTGFTAAYLGEAVSIRFRDREFIDLTKPADSPQAVLLRSLLESEKSAVESHRVVITRPGIGFKGFLPAVFARHASERFFEKTGIRLKLTGADPRFPGNKPDAFEAQVLRMFSDPRHPKGQVYAKETMVNGKPVMRVMDPEYAGITCLACHGGLKGDRDMTGMIKDGWKAGELAGAISLTMPLR